ncbi:uncharacterized protein LOC108472048 [Gossypium arboreum]|uniref:uncharacterized protein LOC108472048 n=1 Tax=Gossypium arboreum TaxID=29729 RepID=UPI0008192E93|nr:uncharacterized protein LOC108472048 [Gossypium arboreum]
MNLFPVGNICHLSHSTSDHCPFLLNTESDEVHTKSSKFRFEAWWTLEDSLEQEIKDSWEASNGSLIEKLKRLQVRLQSWAGTIKKKRERLKRKLSKDLEILVEKERDDETMEKSLIQKSILIWRLIKMNYTGNKEQE